MKLKFYNELLKSLKARIEQKKLHENKVVFERIEQKKMHENKVVFEVFNQNIQNRDE